MNDKTARIDGAPAGIREATKGQRTGLDMKPVEALALWHGVVLQSVRKAAPDLSQRQLAVMLNVYLTPPPHTVRGLAERLNVSKPAITRALDTLGRLGLIKRKRDPEDRRNVLVQRTVKGSVFLSDFADTILTTDIGIGAPEAVNDALVPGEEEPDEFRSAADAGAR